MAYMELLQGSLKSLAAAGEAGRRTVDGMLGPMNGAVTQMKGAVSELETLPVVGGLIGGQLNRVMGGIAQAQAKVGKVLAVYNQASNAVTQVQERVAEFGEQADRAKKAISNIADKYNQAGGISGMVSNFSLSEMFSSASIRPKEDPPKEAIKAFPHLLILQPLSVKAEPFYFNLDTAAFDELRRKTSFRWAAQERLTRRSAQQAVGIGDERLTLKGAIFPSFRGGLGQLDTLRSIGGQLQPLGLTTGYGQVLGNWCLTDIEEEQPTLLQGGIPRKQAFTLEFTRYGDDLSNV